MNRTELLAPAGDMSCLEAAIAAGADAVYLGGRKFGARAFAGNFSDEELSDAVRLAHFFGKKIYLTVNTLTKDSELEELIPWLAPFYEAGLDGLIIQDFGVLERCRRAFPDILLHASTQMTVTESETALFLKGLGVGRVVPARELSLEEIILLKQETGMELETFIHGALCYSYSGQCLFSSFLGGRSGNRGRCAQPCRLPYQIQAADGKAGKKGGRAPQYPLSLKDLCTLPFLPKLLDAGIDSFKIEGRMKRPEYVAGVTALYRKYMDMYEKDPKGWRVDRADLDLLSHLYVRAGLSGGYYEKHNGKEMATLQKPGYEGASDAVLEEIREKYLKKGLTRPVNLSINLQKGKPVKMTASCGNVRVEKEGVAVMPALNKPLLAADVEKQLRKTGGSRFYVRQAKIILADSVFLPISAVNELRRRTLEALFVKIAGISERKLPDAAVSDPAADDGTKERTQEFFCVPEDANTPVRVSALWTSQAAEALKMAEVKRIYLSADAFFDGKVTEPFLESVRRRKTQDRDFSFWLTLPVILRAYSGGWFERFMAWMLKEDHESLTDGLQAGSLSGVLWARKYGWKKEISLNHSAYVFNRDTLAFFRRYLGVECFTAPLELNRNEIKRLPVQNMEASVYGRIPMMQSAGCVKKTAGDCKLSHTTKSLSEERRMRSFRYSLKDRYQAEFPVLVNCNHCMNTVYNSVPLSLHQYRAELAQRRFGALRLDFADEKAEEASRILRFFCRGEGTAPVAYTTGHYKKGVQ